MKVLLTGGTGFIGRPLAARLVARGWEVVALVRRPASVEAAELAALGARLTPGDVTDPAAVRAAMTGAERVVHNAGWYEFGLQREAAARMRAVNVEGTETVLATAAALGVARAVHVSSIVAFGPTGRLVADETFERRVRPGTVYEATKAEAHEIARRWQARGLPLVIACPAGVIGPGDHSSVGHLARWYLRHRLPPGLLPRGSRAIVHVDDVAEAIALAVERGRDGESYILAGGNESLREMHRRWTRFPGGSRRWLALPRPLAAAACAVAEPVQRLFGWPVVLSREVLATGCEDYLYSGAKAERELGIRCRDPDSAWRDTLTAELARRCGGAPR